MDLSAVVHFLVHIRPYFKATFQVVRVRKGQHIKFTCPVFGEKPINVIWSKDGNDIDLLRRYGRLQSASLIESERTFKNFSFSSPPLFHSFYKIFSAVDELKASIICILDFAFPTMQIC